MNIINLIDNQDKLNAMTLRELRNTVERFPFYHAARLLYIQNLYQLHEPNLSEELTKASILVPNRNVLFNMIEGKNYQLDRNEDNRVEIENDENRTIELIDDFLSNVDEEKKGNKNHVPHSVPTIADLTSDYASFLQMQDNVIETDDTAEHEQDRIIESFIEENKGKQRYDMKDDGHEPVGPNMEEGDDMEELYNENIVNIYIKQGRYQQALEILRTICLNNPEKNANFASQMRLLETIVNNNKQ